MKKVMSFLLALILCLSLVAVPQAAVSAASAKTPAKVTGLKITTANKSKQLKLTWKQQKGVSGYQVYRGTADKKESYQKIATLKGAARVSYTDTKLKSSKTYFYAVRAYLKANGKVLYGKFAKTNLSTRLTKGAIKINLTMANQFYVGWINPCLEALQCTDQKDRKPIPGEKYEAFYYVRVKSKKFQSVSDLKKEASKYYTKDVYDMILSNRYADIDGKLYIANYDTGGDAYMQRAKLKIVALTDTVCKIRLTDPENMVYPANYTLVYQNGRWLNKNSIGNPFFYEKRAGFWV